MAWHAWGKLEETAGAPEEARLCYLTALQLDPRSVHSLSALGCLERRAGNLEAAEERLQAALELQPAHVPSLHELALVREAQVGARQGSRAVCACWAGWLFAMSV